MDDSLMVAAKQLEAAARLIRKLANPDVYAHTADRQHSLTTEIHALINVVLARLPEQRTL